jgi:hypothetical protein
VIYLGTSDDPERAVIDVAKTALNRPILTNITLSRGYTKYSVILQYPAGVMSQRPDFPTTREVQKATKEQLARWYRFLPSGDTPEQQRIMMLIEKRFKSLGGMTPALSKKIGV